MEGRSLVTRMSIEAIYCSKEHPNSSNLSEMWFSQEWG